MVVATTFYLAAATIRPFPGDEHPSGSIRLKGITEMSSRMNSGRSKVLIIEDEVRAVGADGYARFPGLKEQTYTLETNNSAFPRKNCIPHDFSYILNMKVEKTSHMLQRQIQAAGSHSLHIFPVLII